MLATAIGPLLLLVSPERLPRDTRLAPAVRVLLVVVPCSLRSDSGLRSGAVRGRRLALRPSRVGISRRERTEVLEESIPSFVVKQSTNFRQPSHTRRVMGRTAGAAVASPVGDPKLEPAMILPSWHLEGAVLPSLLS